MVRQILFQVKVWLNRFFGWRINEINCLTKTIFWRGGHRLTSFWGVWLELFSLGMVYGFRGFGWIWEDNFGG